jgi:hypothetical protein
MKQILLAIKQITYIRESDLKLEVFVKSHTLKKIKIGYYYERMRKFSLSIDGVVDNPTLKWLAYHNIVQS